MFEPVHTFSPYSGYDWYEIEVYYNKRLDLWAYDSQSGCSCYSFERKPFEEQTWTRWNDFLTSITETFREAAWESEQDKAQAYANLRALRSKYKK